MSNRKASLKYKTGKSLKKTTLSQRVLCSPLIVLKELELVGDLQVNLHLYMLYAILSDCNIKFSVVFWIRKTVNFTRRTAKPCHYLYIALLTNSCLITSSIKTKDLRTEAT